MSIVNSILREMNSKENPREAIGLEVGSDEDAKGLQNLKPLSLHSKGKKIPHA